MYVNHMQSDVEKLHKATLKKQAFRVNLTRTVQVERETKELSKQRRVYVPPDQLPIVNQDAWTRAGRDCSIGHSQWMYNECLDHVRKWYPNMTQGLTDCLKHASTHQDSYINDLEASGNNALEPLILERFPELERPMDKDLFSIKPVRRYMDRYHFGKPHFGLFVRLLFDASSVPLLLIDQMRDGRLLRLVYGSDSGLNRGERQTKRVLNQMIKNTMVNVDTVNRDEAARVLFKLKTSYNGNTATYWRKEENTYTDLHSFQRYISRWWNEQKFSQLEEDIALIN